MDVNRYFPIPPPVLKNKTIMDYWHDNKDIIICHAARRSFKTEIAKRRIINFAVSNDNKRILIGASTWSQVVKIYWKDLMLMIPRQLISETYKFKSITLTNGTYIELFSCTAPEQIEGQGRCHMIVLDEASEYDIEAIYNTNLGPIIGDIPDNEEPCKLLIIGIPRTHNMEFKNFIVKFKQPEFADKCSVYTWSSETILSDKKITDNKRLYDERTYITEFTGQFVDDMSGMAYYQFNEAVHVQPVKFDTQMGCAIAMDFNFGILSPLIIQHVYRNKMVKVVTEVTDRNTNIYKIAPLLKQKLVELYGNETVAKSKYILFYGDAAGFQNTANSRGSAWQELKELFAGWNVDFSKIHKSNPHIDLRISEVNRMLRSADGLVHTMIDPSCKELLLDMKNVSFEDVTSGKAKQVERTHASDAWGYFIHAEYPFDKTAMYNG